MKRLDNILNNSEAQLSSHDTSKWKELSDNFDKAKRWQNHREHCEIYLKHQPQEEKDFYDESIRLHTELFDELKKELLEKI